MNLKTLRPKCLVEHYLSGYFLVMGWPFFNHFWPYVRNSWTISWPFLEYFRHSWGFIICATKELLECNLRCFNKSKFLFTYRIYLLTSFSGSFTLCGLCFNVLFWVMNRLWALPGSFFSEVRVQEEHHKALLKVL